MRCGYKKGEPKAELNTPLLLLLQREEDARKREIRPVLCFWGFPGRTAGRVGTCGVRVAAVNNRALHLNENPPLLLLRCRPP